MVITSVSDLNQYKVDDKLHDVLAKAFGGADAKVTLTLGSDKVSIDGAVVVSGTSGNHRTQFYDATGAITAKFTRGLSMF